MVSMSGLLKATPIAANPPTFSAWRRLISLSNTCLASFAPCLVSLAMATVPPRTSKGSGCKSNYA